MEKVVRNYYSTPIMFAETAFVPHMGGAMSIPPQKFRVSERYTVTGIWDKATGNVKFGVAVCNVNDRFERKIGRELAEKKAETNPICEVPDVQTFEQQRLLNYKLARQMAQYLLNRYMSEQNVKFEDRRQADRGGQAVRGNYGEDND